MVPHRVSLITIGCFDLQLLREFYNAIGWKETDHGFIDYAVFKTAGVMLSLYSVENLAKDSGLEVQNQPNIFKGVTFAINVDRPEQVDSVVDQVKTVGGEILSAPSGAFWGGRSASFADPEKNIWEVAFNPDSTFDERGAMLTI